MEQLKPCPFCGSKQVQIRQIKGGWSVGCTTSDGIPNAEKILLERYGIKENDK